MQTQNKTHLKLMKTDASDIKSFQVLTEKQIIKQLKCLIAKQQQQINQLIHEVQKLKNQKYQSQVHPNHSIAFDLESSRALQNHFHSNQHLSKSSSFQASVLHSKNSTNRQFKHSQTQRDPVFKNFQKYIKQFTIKVLQPYQEKYFSTLKNSKNLKEKDQDLKLQENLKETNYENLAYFSQFFPNFLNQSKVLLKLMDSRFQQKPQIEQTLRKKLIQQEKTLKQMMVEYEKNIVDSQKMQTKLLEEIKRLKQSHGSAYKQNFAFEKYNY